ncbi:actin interacting protein 3-domain-containing protein [Suillus fuscotomentosus]|uniref:Actin interacting protein 3-domain-containing protein n=1 Tax=Suillus fuscotomentosus TaxID=1912939 RepID=A0AAD4E4N7_9AGAM|nr:actin interacting protein 3-domain-containing protein [Suillus fuscotomentosus]KAG1899495.1 actin interacting protein 3-domain-containing protein [Suillus fuscotomentosus]
MSSTRSTPPSQPYTGHTSRRDHQSIASNHSSSSSSSRSSRSHAHPAVESAVTRLLVAIKQLLESLTQWSTGKMDEIQVSDVYVRLGNDFNAAVAAFAAFNIDMSDLMSVPEDLREVLETCLAEEATQDNLNVYLPTVRKIITNLLQGLRGKQSMYRRIVSEHQSRHRSSHSRTDSRSSKSDKTSRRDDDSRHRSQLSRSVMEEEGDQDRDRDSTSRQSARSSARRQDPRTQTPPPESPSPIFREPDDETPPNERTITNIVNGHTNRSSAQPRARQSQNTYRPDGDALSRDSSESLVAPSVAANPHHASSSESDKHLPQTPPQSVPVPASVKRYSLVDRPVSLSPPPLPAVLVDEAPSTPIETSSPQTHPIDNLQAPAVASSLAALKKSDVLERRASKRFSTYNITKMTGSRERSGNRRSMAAGPLLTPGDLAVLTEVDEPDIQRNGSTRSSRTIARTPSPMAEVEAAPPVPPLPPLTEPARSQQVHTLSKADNVTDEPTIFEEAFEPTLPITFSAFLQVGREVKKVTIEPGLSLSSLRMLFVDKFSYNPGLENFPAIYIRDPSSGVQYELEDIEEVKEKCLLSLNIEPLDQIKQHIDTQISVLSNDLKELRTTISNERRSSHISPIVAHDFVESTPRVDRPSEKQLHNVARRLSRIVGDVSSSSPFMLPQMTGQSLQLQPQMTGASVMSEYSNRVVDDLKTQFDEVQNLRRDLGIMRQLYTEFMKSTKDSLGALRTQTQSVKQLASVKVGGARGFIDQGKTKLDSRSQNVLTKVEELQDTVEALRDDVLKRHMTPKPQLVKQIQEDIASTATELASLKEHIDTVRPMWKKTWEEELQNIVEEQGFLGHQEEFLTDLLEDHKALVDVFGHVEKVISIRGATPGRNNRSRGFKPPPADEGHTGLSTVMMEIRGAAVDPDRRMKAIEANQKNRERELASRSDEFQEELTGFVGGKKLRMTGGAEEVDRVRQRRNELALKAMFNSASASVDNLSGSPSAG